jgi:hypothetical protein
MMSDAWMVMESSVGMSALGSIIGHTVTYRVHKIVVKTEREYAVATVFDGTTPVFSAHAYTDHEALARAQAWVDEQDESLAAYDLRTG